LPGLLFGGCPLSSTRDDAIERAMKPSSTPAGSENKLRASPICRRLRRMMTRRVAPRHSPGNRSHPSCTHNDLAPSSAERNRPHRKEADVYFHTTPCNPLEKSPSTSTHSRVDCSPYIGHKFYAPKGIGALYVRVERRCRPALYAAITARFESRHGKVAGIGGIGQGAEIRSKNA